MKEEKKEFIKNAGDAKDNEDKNNDNEISKKNKKNVINEEIENESENKEEKLDDLEKKEEFKEQLEELNREKEEYIDMLQRSKAEFENYKKRTQREKEALRKDVICDVVSEFIKVVDNLERALEFDEEDCNYKTVREGVVLVYKQMNEVLKDLGVEKIECIGEKFDPNLHNAVMHIEDDNYSESEVIEEFQKGYIREEKVIRHSVVKVAN